MIKIISQLDNYSNLWESKELENYLQIGSYKNAIMWLQNNCAYQGQTGNEITKEDFEENLMLCDGVIFDYSGYKLLYFDFGFIEKIELYKI